MRSDARGCAVRRREAFYPNRSRFVASDLKLHLDSLKRRAPKGYVFVIQAVDVSDDRVQDVQTIDNVPPHLLGAIGDEIFKRACDALGGVG